MRTAGVRQPEKFCTLVERLTRGIVSSLAEQEILADPARLDEHRVPP